MPIKRVDPATLPPEVQAMLARSQMPEARREIAELDAQFAGRPSITDLVRRGVISGQFTTRASHEELAQVLAAFRAERQRQGLSLAQMAERVGTHQANLTRFETGRQPNPKLDTLQRYAQALGLHLSLAVSPGEPYAPRHPQTVALEAAAAKGHRLRKRDQARAKAARGKATLAKP